MSYYSYNYRILGNGQLIQVFGVARVGLREIENPTGSRFEDKFKISTLEVVMDGDAFIKTLQGEVDHEIDAEQCLEQMWKKGADIWN